MHEATRLTRMGRLGEATAAIRRALIGTPAAQAPQAPVPPQVPPDAVDSGNREGSGMREDGTHIWDATPVAPGSQQFAVPMPPAAAAANVAASPPPLMPDPAPPPAAPSAPELPAADRDEPPSGTEDFSEGVYKHALQTLRYKLYSPPNHAQHGLPLVVMLHGCTQDPDDFAVGTRMNEFAREQGFFVLYPAQAGSANPSRCWNWFKPIHQQRDSGEPGMIAGATEAIIGEYDIDKRRVYIAGLSAGGAMAVIVADAYPEIFSAVGVHSGLPRGAASNVISALSVMKRSGSPPPVMARTHPPAPTIVFHGDEDNTVHPQNGEYVLAAALQQGTANAAAVQVERGEPGPGRAYTRSIYRDSGGAVQAEHWLVHGAGHAWAGGDGEGSHTDATGPDATRAMLNFFFERSRAETRN